MARRDRPGAGRGRDAPPVLVAHQLSAIAVQAGAARLAAPGDPHAAPAAIAAIERQARIGLTELNWLVRELRLAGDTARAYRRRCVSMTSPAWSGGPRNRGCGPSCGWKSDGLLAGASGFLLKQAPPEEILLAVRAAAAGDALVSPAPMRRLVEHFVLMIRGLSNAAIARRLVIGETTAKTHVTHIMTKLQLRDRAHAVIYGYETGLVRPGESDAGNWPPATGRAVR